MSEHSLFSPSASHRTLNCPPSLMLCAKQPDGASSYAEEGTCAHELCAYLVEKSLGRHVRDPTGNLSNYDAEMQSCAEGYTTYVMESYDQAKISCPDARVFVEQRVDISRWVPGCGGTADCIIVADGTLTVIDYKHGVGVPVSAESEEFVGNPQLMCYCLGALEMFDGIYNIDTVKMAIYQPRRENVSEHTMSKADLLHWADTVLAPTAKLALEGKGEFKAGEHCRFCKIKATCRTRAEQNLAAARYDFQPPAELTDEEIDEILLRTEYYTDWLGDIRGYALAKALQGKDFAHFKVVEGRSVRKYTSETDVAKAVAAAGYDPYEKKLLGITAMTGLLGKKKFQEILGDLTFKPQGKPTLVLKSDKRLAWKNTATEDFNM